MGADGKDGLGWRSQQDCFPSPQRNATQHNATQHNTTQPTIPSVARLALLACICRSQLPASTTRNTSNDLSILQDTAPARQARHALLLHSFTEWLGQTPLHADSGRQCSSFLRIPTCLSRCIPLEPAPDSGAHKSECVVSASVDGYTIQSSTEAAHKSQPYAMAQTVALIRPSHCRTLTLGLVGTDQEWCLFWAQHCRWPRRCSCNRPLAGSTTHLRWPAPEGDDRIVIVRANKQVSLKG